VRIVAAILLVGRAPGQSGFVSLLWHLRALPENDVSGGAAALKQLASFFTTVMPPSQLGILDSLAAPSISHSNALPAGRTRVTL